MQFRKHISKLLALGILTNNIYFNSSANTEIPNRYQALEGEHITIDDSTEGELVEIEVFGNTVQDENNLEDIQSVGDLYVDDKGDPILDSQGREQYKIDITSTDDSLILSNNEIFNNGIDYQTKGWDATRLEIKSKKIRVVVTNKDGLSRFVKLAIKNDIEDESNLVSIFHVNTPFDKIEIDYELKNSNILSFCTYGDLSIHNNFLDYYDIKIYTYDFKDELLSSSTKSNTVILLPTQLQKVGDVADRLYWDNKRGRYVIEKNIDSIILNGSENWNVFYIQTVYDDMNPFLLRDDNLFSRFPFGYTKAISNIARNEEPHNWRNTDRWFKYTEYEGVKCVGINLEPSLTDVEYCNAESFKNFLSKNNMIIYLPLSSPNLIDTNIMSKLKIPTYDGKTYIFVDSENGISPTLKVIVDRTINRAKEAIAIAKANPTMENISLARMWTNLIKESTIKDELQGDITQITEVVDLTINKKTTTANLDLYIKSSNSLTMSLSTNSVTFENYSGVEDLEMLNAVNVIINSSLPYSLNAYMPSLISNADGSNTMDANILNIRDNSKSNYSQFINTTEKVVLKDDCEAGNNNMHNIDLKLSGNNLHKADVYKTVIKFEAVQK